MLRSKTAALVVSMGLVALAFPSSVLNYLSILPGIDIASFPFLRWWGAVYIAAGVLVEWNLRSDRSTQSAIKSVIGVAVACVGTLLLAILLSSESAIFRNFALSAGVVIPLIVGTMDTTKSRLIAVSLVLVPISIGTVVIGRPFSSAAPAVWVPTIFTLYSLVFGIPLYVLGRDWRLDRRHPRAT